MTQPETPPWATAVEMVDDLHRRIDRALSVLAKLDRLPDAGTHDPDCWLTANHRDCLIELLESILRGESRDPA